VADQVEDFVRQFARFPSGAEPAPAIFLPAPVGVPQALLALGILPRSIPFLGPGPVLEKSQHLVAGSHDLAHDLSVAPGGAYAVGRVFEVADDRFRLAIQADDLRELAERGLIAGVKWVTPYEAEEWSYRQRLRWIESGPNTDTVLNLEILLAPDPPQKPSAPQDPTAAYIEDEGVRLTDAGWLELSTFLASAYDAVPAELRSAVAPLLDANRFEEALGEAWRLIERTMQQQIRSAATAGTLITMYCARLIQAGMPKAAGALSEPVSSFVKEIRDELRSAFHYAGGESKEVTRLAGTEDSRAALIRLGRLYESIRSAADAVGPPGAAA
jgi:hypothetical protein